jgi:SAM-dependent methyltransferase
MAGAMEAACQQTALVDDSIVAQVAGTLALADFHLKASHRILDFGCGAGKQVRAFRDTGYLAYGVDLRNFVQDCAPEEKQWFQLSRDRHIYRLPYPDNFFDVIYSANVLEHLVYYEPALEEMRRVLKPDGVSLHIFPSKWRPVEGHFFTPFGGFIRWWPWLKLWAFLGAKNPGLPAGVSRSEHGDINWKASRTNYTYYSHRELMFLFSLFFGDVRFIEKEFVAATVATSKFSRMVRAISRVIPKTFWLYHHFHRRVALLSGYSVVERERDGIRLF